MKASYHGYTFEVDSVIGKDGMEYPAQDVVLIEPDWPSFRREAAKDILANMMSCPTSLNLGDKTIKTVGDHISFAIGLADELIKQLREGEK